MRIRLICLGVLLCTAALAQPAAAQVQPAGTGEPLFTNSAQNTQFFEWPAQASGIDAYQVQYRYYANNAETASPDRRLRHGRRHRVGQLVRRGQPPARRPVRHLRPGRATRSPTTRCSIPDGPNSCSMGTMLGRRAYTTIDRSKPSAAITLAGGAAYTRDAKVALKVDFSDDVAGPFPANFVCFQYGGGPTGLCDNAKGFIYGYNAPCSVPAGGGKSTSFTCTADYGSGGEPGARRPAVGVRARRRRGDPGQPVELEPERLGGQGQPLRPGLRRRRARPHRAGRLDRGLRDRGQGRRARDLPGAGHGRDLRRRRRRARGPGATTPPAAAAPRRRTRSRRPAPTRSSSRWPTTPATPGTATKVITVSAPSRRRHDDAGRRHDDAGRRHDHAGRRHDDAGRRHDHAGRRHDDPGDDGADDDAGTRPWPRSP